VPERTKRQDQRARDKVERAVDVDVDVPVMEPPTRSKPNNAPRRLGGSTDAVTGLTPEMRANVERERRARAAEKRLEILSESGRPG